MSACGAPVFLIGAFAEAARLVRAGIGGDVAGAAGSLKQSFQMSRVMQTGTWSEGFS